MALRAFTLLCNTHHHRSPQFFTFLNWHLNWWRCRLHGHAFEQALGVGDGQGGLACCRPWVAWRWTWLSNWTDWLELTLSPRNTNSHSPSPPKATQTRKSGKATKIQVFLMAKPLSFPRHAAGGVEATAVGYHRLPPAAHSPLLEDCPDWRIWRITTAQQHFSQLVFWLGSGLEFCNTSMLWMETFRLLWKMCLCLAS